MKSKEEALVLVFVLVLFDFCSARTIFSLRHHKRGGGARKESYITLQLDLGKAFRFRKKPLASIPSTSQLFLRAPRAIRIVRTSHQSSNVTLARTIQSYIHAMRFIQPMSPSTHFHKAVIKRSFVLTKSTGMPYPFQTNTTKYDHI